MTYTYVGQFIAVTGPPSSSSREFMHGVPFGKEHRRVSSFSDDPKGAGVEFLITTAIKITRPTLSPGDRPFVLPGRWILVVVVGYLNGNICWDRQNKETN